jgi:hypothetical protein
MSATHRLTAVWEVYNEKVYEGPVNSLRWDTEIRWGGYMLPLYGVR